MAKYQIKPQYKRSQVRVSGLPILITEGLIQHPKFDTFYENFNLGMYFDKIEPVQEVEDTTEQVEENVEAKPARKRSKK